MGPLGGKGYRALVVFSATAFPFWKRYHVWVSSIPHGVLVEAASHGLGPPGDSIFSIETTWSSSASPRKPAGVRQPAAKSLESCGYSPSEKISLLSAEEADPDRPPVPEPPSLRSKHSLVLLQSCIQ